MSIMNELAFRELLHKKRITLERVLKGLNWEVLLKVEGKETLRRMAKGGLRSTRLGEKDDQGGHL